MRGSTDVRVRWKSKDYLLPLLVVQGTGCGLLGHSWFEALKISISGINLIQKPCRLEEILGEHKTVFADSSEGHVGPSIDIKPQKDTVPQFRKARPVPFALGRAVECELQDWERGFITPLQHSDRATPVVIVRKKDGGIRLCGDYKSSQCHGKKRLPFLCPLPVKCLPICKVVKCFSDWTSPRPISICELHWKRLRF